MKYFGIVQYDGTDFQGWQVQPNSRSVEGEIEKVLSQVLNTEINIYGSGRTDAGVHALGQTFHFVSEKAIPDLDKLTYSVNCLLPEDIHLVSLIGVDDDFNARLSATSKTYIYILNTGNFDVFNRRFANQFCRPLDVEKMKEVAALFVGEHNFQNFTAKEEDEDGFVRTVNDLKVDFEEGVVSFAINGDGFMRYMVRMIVGTLIEVGLGKVTREDVQGWLDSKSRHVVSYKAAANGLFLYEVAYN